MINPVQSAIFGENWPPMQDDNKQKIMNEVKHQLQ